MAKRKTKVQVKDNYSNLVNDLSGILESARKTSARSINTILTAAYWSIGQRIVEYEYKGKDRSEYYGERLLEKLSYDLQMKFGRGFSRPNLTLMKLFYQNYSEEKIRQTLSNKSLRAEHIRQTPSGKSSSDILQTLSAQSFIAEISNAFPLPWSHYVRFLSVKDEQARKFYESEALRNGWSVRQLDRQISSQFYERTLLSKNKSAMLKKAEKPLPEDLVSPEEEIKDPVILEFLGLER